MDAHLSTNPVSKKLQGNDTFLKSLLGNGIIIFELWWLKNCYL